MPGKLLHGVRKIAVLRANGIGDLMFALPALDALRAAYPHAEIVLLASEWHRAFLEGRPGPVDRVIVVPPSRGVRQDSSRPEDPDELERFFEAMRREHFDLAVQLHGGGRNSNPFVRRLGARITAGLRTPDAEALDRVLPYIYFQPEIARYLEVVALVGASALSLEPRIAVTDRDLQESMAAVSSEDARLVVMHPSASDLRRRWPAEKFAEAAAMLRRDGMDVYVIGVEGDRELVTSIVEAMGGEERHNLCGRLSLSGLSGLLSRAALVVSNDSGPLHLAGAVGAATVGIYWCGNVITAAPLARARHRPVISWRLHCPRCGASAIDAPCAHRDSFVADVRVDDVVTAARDLLSGETGRVPELRMENDEGALEPRKAG